MVSTMFIAHPLCMAEAHMPAQHPHAHGGGLLVKGEIETDVTGQPLQQSHNASSRDDLRHSIGDSGQQL